MKVNVYYYFCNCEGTRLPKAREISQFGINAAGCPVQQREE